MSMKVIIVGAGVVGTSLAEQLSTEGHQVAVVDQDRNRVRALNEHLEVLAMAGSGALPSVLHSVGVTEAEMVIAVTSNDEVNLVVGMVATRLGVPHRIVRIRNPEYAAKDSVLSLESLGIHHVVNPEPSIVEALSRMMDLPGSYDFATLAGGQVEMFGFHVAEDSPAIGRTLRELRELGSLNAFLVLYITRDGQAIVPKGDDTLKRGDNVHVLVSADTTEFLLPIVHPHTYATRHVIIIGATRIGMELVEQLQRRVKHITLIEPNEEQAEYAAQRLSKAMVLKGDPTDLRVLEEASIDRCDYFCALSDDDQLNMLSTLLAMRHGADHTAVLVAQPEYVPVLDSLGVDIVLNPRLAIVGEIMRHVRRGHIFSVTRLAEAEGEVIEMQALPGCLATRQPLKKLKFPRDALVGALVREGEMQIPNGETQIKAGDRVLVYALPAAIPKIEKMFS